MRERDAHKNFRSRLVFITYVALRLFPAFNPVRYLYDMILFKFYVLSRLFFFVDYFCISTVYIWVPCSI